MFTFDRPDQRIARDPEREGRLETKIVVDCYDEVEKASGWYCHLESNLAFPFKAGCCDERSISPLREGETVVVTGMADIDDCTREMFVRVTWEGRAFGVPLAQLAPVDADVQTTEAVGDWHYWDRRGYRLG